MSISLEAKLRALREVESIYALAKKWKKLTPDEKPPNWERIADAVLKKALSQPVDPEEVHMRLVRDGMHHEHDPESARLIERTLKNGVVHPDVLHSYRQGTPRQQLQPVKWGKPPRADTMPVQHIVQHQGDLQYPSYHEQGYGFVPSMSEVPSHVLLENVNQEPSALPPTKQGGIV